LQNDFCSVTAKKSELGSKNVESLCCVHFYQYQDLLSEDDRQALVSFFPDLLWITPIEYKTWFTTKSTSSCLNPSLSANSFDEIPFETGVANVSYRIQGLIPTEESLSSPVWQSHKKNI